MTEKQKTSVDDIIGIIKTEEKTNSVELKKEYYKNQSKDKHYTYLNYSKNGYIGSFYDNGKPLTNKKVCDLLNALHEENQNLKDDLIRHLEEIGNKTLIEEMEEKYSFNYSDEHYRVDTMDREKIGLEPLWRSYYD